MQKNTTASIGRVDIENKSKFQAIQGFLSAASSSAKSTFFIMLNYIMMRRRKSTTVWCSSSSIIAGLHLTIRCNGLVRQKLIFPLRSYQLTASYAYVSHVSNTFSKIYWNFECSEFTLKNRIMRKGMPSFYDVHTEGEGGIRLRWTHVDDQLHMDIHPEN